jgi:hypothetical protein
VDKSSPFRTPFGTVPRRGRPWPRRDHAVRQPDDLEQLWLEAGLDEVRVEPLVAEAAYDDFDDLWAPFPTGVGPAGRYAASLDADAQATLHDEFFRRLGEPQARSRCRPARGVPSGGSTSRKEHSQGPGLRRELLTARSAER